MALKRTFLHVYVIERQVRPLDVALRFERFAPRKCAGWDICRCLLLVRLKSCWTMMQLTNKKVAQSKPGVLWPQVCLCWTVPVPAGNVLEA